MTIEACAEIVERGDPDRFLATMTAPAPDRARLWPLYAFNLEVARAPWASAEPMVGAMRLQFWADTLDDIAAGRPPRAHEVARPLADLVRAAGLPVAPLAQIVAARQADLDPDAPADAAGLWSYLEATGGTLMAQAARALGADAAVTAAAAEAGTAAAMANWLLAVPALRARGRHPLPDRPETLAAQARDRLASARRAAQGAGGVPPRIRPAFRAAWRAEALLRMAQTQPARVPEGRLVQSEFVRRGSLLWRTLRGGW
ncbi:MAG: squalene/phytoene synthase family protein [Alkalilacustris sp.]